MQVWRNQAVSDRLGWYRSVMRGVKPAKFLLCKSIACDIDMDSSDEEALWLEHDRLSAQFKAFHGDILQGKIRYNAATRPRSNLLDL